MTEGIPGSAKPAGQRIFDSSNEAKTGKPIEIQPGDRWSFTFTQPGTYDYYCIPHPYMRSRITVLPAGASGQGGKGYGDFTVVLTGKEIYGMTAFGLVVLVAMMVVFARTGRKTNN